MVVKYFHQRECRCIYLSTVSLANTTGGVSAGVTKTGHQNGLLRQPCSSDPFSLSKISAGVACASWRAIFSSLFFPLGVSGASSYFCDVSLIRLIFRFVRTMSHTLFSAKWNGLIETQDLINMM